MARKQYSKSDIKELFEKTPYAQKLITKKSNVVLDDEVLYVDNVATLIKYEDSFYPHLKVILKNPDLLPKVTVDMGAIKFVIKGADIMRPGITNIEDSKEGSFVAIIDETHSKSIAVGLMLHDSEEMRAMESGKVIKNIHYIGDDIWNK